MARITLMDICDGIAADFNGQMVVLNAGMAAVPIIAQSYDQITEGLQDTPTLQIYPTDSITDAATDTDRTTFKGCVKHGSFTFTMLAFARPRSHVGEDLEAAARLWDACEAILEEEGADCDPHTGVCTFFGYSTAGIRSIAWSGALPRVWDYGGASYVGFELTIVVEVF